MTKKKGKKFIKSKIDTKGPGFRTSDHFKASIFGKNANRNQSVKVNQRFVTQHKG